MNKIAILSAGSDAPGMNAAIRAIVYYALGHGLKPYGVRDGFEGLADDRFIPLTLRSVDMTVHLSGSILGCNRFADFAKEDVQKKALEYLKGMEIDAVIVLGGDGTLRAAGVLEQLGIPTLGVIATINNDVVETDTSIGFDTAANNAVRLIDGLRPTARAQQRAFLVEVMGGHCGYLALAVGLATGADIVVTPEFPASVNSIAERLLETYQKTRPYGLIIVAEGAAENADQLAAQFATHNYLTGFDVRVLRLGHLLRGGAPSAYDRLLATKLGCAAVDYLRQGKHGIALIVRNNTVDSIPLKEIHAASGRTDGRIVELARLFQDTNLTFSAVPRQRTGESVHVQIVTAPSPSAAPAAASNISKSNT